MSQRGHEVWWAIQCERSVSRESSLSQSSAQRSPLILARPTIQYHLALHQIDSLRQDGKFLSEDGSIPEGQGILVAQLSEAHELLEMLKENTGDASDDDDEEALSDDEGDEEVNYSLSKAAPLDATPRTRQAGEEL
jgi:hypothetical protein